MARFLHYLIRFYQIVISPLLGPRCRYLPTCSQYAIEAIREHGAVRGSVFASKRLCRCHPWGGSGYDPVPKAVQPIRFDYVDSEHVQPIVPFRDPL